MLRAGLDLWYDASVAGAGFDRLTLTKLLHPKRAHP